jgi:hypothetical protein
MIKTPHLCPPIRGISTALSGTGAFLHERVFDELFLLPCHKLVAAAYFGYRIKPCNI